MKKIIFSIVLFIALSCAYIFTAITFINYNQIFGNLASATKLSIKNIDQLEYQIKFFPKPRLLIREIIDENKIELEDIKIEFSPMSILQFATKVTSIKIGNIKIHINHDDVQLLSHNEFISELINKEALDIEAEVKRLEFIESDKDIPITLENFYFDGLVPNTKFSGKIAGLGNIEGHFNYHQNDLIDFYLNIGAKEFNAQIKETYKNSSLQNGHIKINTKNLASKIGRLIPDFNQLVGSFNSSEEVDIEFDINAIDSWLKFNNIKIQSPSILGEGSIEMSKNPNDVNQINLRFSKIDLNSLEQSKSESNLTHTGFTSGNKLDFKENKMNASIVIDKMQLNSNNALIDVVLLADINANKFTIKRFTGNIDQSGQFIISGTAEQNSFRSLFQGNIVVSHSDLNDLAEHVAGPEFRSDSAIPYVLSSDVKLSSVDVSLQNIVLKTTDNELSGNMSIKFIGNVPRISATLGLDNLNMNANNFPVAKRIYEYATDLTKGTNDDSYLGKFTSLRQMKAMSNLNININELLLGETIYDNFYFNMILSPGRIKLSNFVIKDGDDFVDMNIDLQAQGIKPSISVKVNDGSVGVDFLSPGSMLELRNKILQEFAIDKFDMIFNVYLSRVYQKDVELGRVVFLARTNNKLIEIQNFDTDIFKGRLKSSGSILLEPYTLNFVYALNSAQIRDIIDLIPPGYIDTNGAISASGMWTSNGNSIRELLYNLYTRSTIITKDITVRNFSYDDLVQKANSQGYSVRDLRSDIKSALLTGVTQIEDLKTDLELSKGIMQMPTIKFKTKYTSGSASAAINIYDFSINLDSIFSFTIASDPVRGRSYVDYIPANIKLKATGSIFTPKKEGDVTELEEIIRRRQN